MATEVKLTPGWLIRDVRIAAARLDPTPRAVNTTSQTSQVVTREKQEQPQSNNLSQHTREANLR